MRSSAIRPPTHAAARGEREEEEGDGDEAASRSRWRGGGPADAPAASAKDVWWRFARVKMGRGIQGRSRVVAGRSRVVAGRARVWRWASGVSRWRSRVAGQDAGVLRDAGVSLRERVGAVAEEDALRDDARTGTRTGGRGAIASRRTVTCRLRTAELGRRVALGYSGAVDAVLLGTAWIGGAWDREPERDVRTRPAPVVDAHAVAAVCHRGARFDEEEEGGQGGGRSHS